MESLLFHGGTIYTTAGAWEDGWLLVSGGTISALGRGKPPEMSGARFVDLDGCDLLPGLIDMHIHGAAGHDVMESDPEALRTIARFLARHGVTSFLASTITASPDQIRAALRTIGDVMHQDTGGAQLLGAHLEGPYINAARRGAHDPDQIRLARADEYNTYLKMGIKLLTLAPEFPENLDLLRAAVSMNITVALGHSCASYEQTCQAAALGASQVTHLFNAMEPLHHRHPGMIGAALTLPGLTCELIADLLHLAAPTLQLALKAKGADKIVLVTDAMSGTGMPDGDYEIWGSHITVRNGEARAASGALAGSTLTLDRGLSNIMRACSLSLIQALPMVTSVPARQLHLPGKGSITVGNDADLVIWDGKGVRMTVVGGKIVYGV